MQVLTKLHTAEPENVEVIWRLCRSYFSLHEDTQDKKEKQDLLTKGLELAKKGLELNDKHWATHKWFAVSFALLIYISTWFLYFSFVPQFEIQKSNSN